MLIFFLSHAVRALCAARPGDELGGGGSILPMRREGDVRPINRIHVGYWSALHNVLLPVAAGSRLHQDVAKRSGQGVAPCCGGSLSSSSMISLHKIKSSRDLEVRTYVHRLAGRSLHTTPPGTDTLSHHNFKCGRVKTSRQWRYLRGSTADSHMYERAECNPYAGFFIQL